MRTLAMLLVIGSIVIAQEPRKGVPEETKSLKVFVGVIKGELRRSAAGALEVNLDSFSLQLADKELKIALRHSGGTDNFMAQLLGAAIGRTATVAGDLVDGTQGKNTTQVLIVREVAFASTLKPKAPDPKAAAAPLKVGDIVIVAGSDLKAPGYRIVAIDDKQTLLKDQGDGSYVTLPLSVLKLK